jgi:hypothetical protein
MAMMAWVFKKTNKKHCIEAALKTDLCLVNSWSIHACLPYNTLGLGAWPARCSRKLECLGFGTQALLSLAGSCAYKSGLVEHLCSRTSVHFFQLTKSVRLFIKHRFSIRSVNKRHQLLFEKLSVMSSLGSNPRSSESETLSVGPRNMYFSKPSREFWCMLKFESHC